MANKKNTFSSNFWYKPCRNEIITNILIFLLQA